MESSRVGKTGKRAERVSPHRLRDFEKALTPAPELITQVCGVCGRWNEKPRQCKATLLNIHDAKTCSRRAICWARPCEATLRPGKGVMPTRQGRSNMALSVTLVASAALREGDGAENQ